MKMYVMVNAVSQSTSGTVMSGGDRRILEFLKRWPRELRDSILLVTPAPFLDVCIQEGVAIGHTILTSTPASLQKSLLGKYIRHTIAAVRQMPRKNPDILFYSSSSFFPDTIPAVIGKKRNKGSQWCDVLHHINLDYKTRPGNKIRNLLAQTEQRFNLWLIRRYADRILTSSPLVYDYLVAKGYGAQRIQVVGNGVDTHLIDACRIPMDSAQEDGVMLARLMPSKGIQDLGDIWQRVCASHPAAHLTVIGGGPQSAKDMIIEDFARRGIPDHITLTGFLSTEEAYARLKNAKVFLFPSHEEGWGISIAEAMACGLPVVTYDLPVYPFIFKGINLSAQSFDTAAFAMLVNHLLDDDAERKKTCPRWACPGSCTIRMGCHCGTGTANYTENETGHPADRKRIVREVTPLRAKLQSLYERMLKSSVGRAILKVTHMLWLDALVFYLVAHVLEPLRPSERMLTERSYFDTHKADIHELIKLFADDLLKRTFQACLAYRSIGAVFPRGIIQADCDKYFPADIFTLNADIFVDCGAFNGDSVDSFIRHSIATGKDYAHIYAFEPSEYNYQILQQFVQNNHGLKITIFKQGVSDCSGELPFNSEGNISEIAKIDTNGASCIQVVRLDEIFVNQNVTFIKMDIESAEPSALRGAQAIIHRDSPILAICSYHTCQDFIHVPLLMKQLEPDAKLYLRHYSKNWMETVCYAVPPNRTIIHESSEVN